FGAGAQVQPPDADALLAVRRRVGAQWLALDAEGNTLAKRVAGVEIDLSAIAKGYASDAVSELLLGMGYPNTMVEVGGEVRVRGRDRKSTRLNSSHVKSSYAVFCLKK